MTSPNPSLVAELRAGNTSSCAGYRAEHFLWHVQDRVGTVTLNRPERKNPLMFSSYAELRDLFGRLRHADDVHAVVVHGGGDNFCSGGDVHEIIGPLIELKAPTPKTAPWFPAVPRSASRITSPAVAPAQLSST